MCKEFKNVIEFNNQVIGLTCVDFLSKERLEWFKGVINEELGEFEVANTNYIEAYVEARGSRDDCMAQACKAEMADALIDLIYFAYGRVYELGILPEQFSAMWDAVHSANMKKKKGNKGRGSDLDAIKPEGWEAPEKKFSISMSAIRGDAGVEENILFQNYTHNEAVDSIKEKAIAAAMPKVFIDAVELCIKKSQDYNNGQDKPASRREYFPFGLLSYAQMLHTKTQRLNSLAQQTKAPNHESIRDTLIDLINYAGFAAEAIDKGEI